MGLRTASHAPMQPGLALRGGATNTEGITFLRWEAGDANEIARSLFAGHTRKKNDTAPAPAR